MAATKTAAPVKPSPEIRKAAAAAVKADEKLVEAYDALTLAGVQLGDAGKERSANSYGALAAAVYKLRERVAQTTVKTFLAPPAAEW